MSLLEENAEILAGMEKDGSNLGPSRPVDFSHVFPDRVSGEGFAALARRKGCETKIRLVTQTDELEGRLEDPWDVTATREMVPTAADLTEWEERLDTLARAHGGRADGWSFFRV